MVRYDLDKRILHGGDYNPDQWLDYPEIIKNDMELMRSAHINTVTLGVFAWSALEPEEGKFCFGWMDDIFERVHQFGGNVILATPSGGRPKWLSQKYPEVNRTDSLGRKHTHGSRHDHCYSSPVYREKVRIINRKLAERYGQHPALSMWHVSNEYSGECFCEYCQENWRQWLKSKYGSLDNINKAWWMSFWSSTYSDWKQILPPSPLGENKVHGMDLDWKRFVTDQTIDFYQAEIAPLREITPQIPVTTNFMAEGQNNHDFIPLEGIDYGKFSKYVDVVSWDSYPDWNNNYESIAKTAMKSAYVHDQYWSLKQQPFIVMESTPSGVNWHQFNKNKRPGVHILSSMQQIAHGSDSTLYFQWRSARGNSEKFHGAVLGYNHSDSDRVFREVSEYGKRLEKIAAVKGADKKSRVAIIFDWESNWALKRGGGFGRPTRLYPQTLQDHYSVFWEKDIAVDIITVEHDFGKYDLLIAPLLYLVTEKTISKLQEYVRQGGTLVSSYFTGMVNETDLLYFGGLPDGLKKLLGIKVLELDTLYENEHNVISFKNTEYQTKDYSAIIETIDADVLAVYQTEFYAKTPAVTKKCFGKGTSYFLAARNSTDFLQDFYAKIIQDLHLGNSLVQYSLPEVSIQTRYNNSEKYHFFMNFSTKEKTMELTRELTDMEHPAKISRHLTLKPYEVKVAKEKMADEPNKW